MTNYTQFISTIKETQVKFIDTFVTDKNLKGHLKSLADAQESIAKTTYAIVENTSNLFLTEAVKKAYASF